MELKLNQEYKRSELHDIFGGSRQSGISPSAQTNIIFIFSAGAGEQYGYYDGWRDDGRFYYTGEGQLGDQQFERGNLALLKHSKNNKRVLLMMETKRSHVKYTSELVCVDYLFDQSHDKEGCNRRTIVFIFEELDSNKIPEDHSLRGFKKHKKPTNTERAGMVMSRVGQGWYRQALLEKFKHRCAVTGLDMPEILIASHIVPWRSSSESERLDEDNGILLSPHYDALFDKHLISFEDDGNILISSKLSSEQILALGISCYCKIHVTEGMKSYLQRHRVEFRK